MRDEKSYAMNMSGKGFCFKWGQQTPWAVWLTRGLFVCLFKLNKIIIKKWAGGFFGGQKGGGFGRIRYKVKFWLIFVKGLARFEAFRFGWMGGDGRGGKRERLVT